MKMGHPRRADLLGHGISVLKSKDKRGLQIKEKKVWVVRIVFKSEVVAIESHIQHKRKKEKAGEHKET